MERWQIKQLQSLPPHLKLQRTERKIWDFMSGVNGQAYIAYSGGLDSRVMLAIVREMGISRERVPAVFVNTGLEYPEVLEVALRHADVVLRPKITFGKLVKKIGYPVASKKISQYVSEVQSALRKGHNESATVKLRLTGIKSNGETTRLGEIPDKWKSLCQADFKVSDKCCKHLKHKPIEGYSESSGRYPLIGLRISDGMQRERTFTERGSCNAFGDSPSSWPLAIWTDKDIWWYIRKYNIDYPTVYDHGETATGCYACMFGIHMEKGENRFQRMYRSHPKHWKQVMDGFGCRKVMEFIGLPVEPERLLL